MTVVISEEEVLHTANWKYAVSRCISEDANISFPRKGSDWPKLPDICDKKAWNNDIKLLINMHKQLMKTVETLPSSKFNHIP